MLVGYCRNVNFSLFSEAKVQFLQNVLLILSKQCKRYKKLRVKEACKGFLKLSRLTSWYLSFLRYCTILFSCKNLCLEITADVSKTWISFQHGIFFILNVLSEIVKVFALICLILETKKRF